jgi:hypothetical protein
MSTELLIVRILFLGVTVVVTLFVVGMAFKAITVTQAQRRCLELGYTSTIQAGSLHYCHKLVNGTDTTILLKP